MSSSGPSSVSLPRNWFAAQTLVARSFEVYVKDASDCLIRPSDFGYFGHDDALWVSSAPTFARHRDSDSIENANFEIVWNGLVENFPDLIRPEARADAEERNTENPGGIYVFSAGHWAVGWIEQIVVPVLINPANPVTADNLHPAFIQVIQAAHAVKMFPALPGAEKMAAEFDHAENVSNAQRVLDYVERHDGRTPILNFTAEDYANQFENSEADGLEISGIYTLNLDEEHSLLVWDEAHRANVAVPAGQASLPL